MAHQFVVVALLERNLNQVRSRIYTQSEAFLPVLSQLDKGTPASMGSNTWDDRVLPI
jgi:hypothetical protein